VKDGLDRFDGLFHDQPDADGRGHVINAVSVSDELFHESAVQDRIDDEAKIRVLLEMGNIRIAARREIIDNRNMMALAYQLVRQMASDKSGTACDKDLHLLEFTTPAK
jgi:hypothetical protein